MRAQVCAVNKALLSVSRMVQAGNRVVSEQRGSYVEYLRSGEKMYMYEKGGMYMLEMWVNKNSEAGREIPVLKDVSQIIESTLQRPPTSSEVSGRNNAPKMHQREGFELDKS